MGISIKATSNDQTKPNYVQAEEAFGALVVGAGELKVWVGSTPLNKVEILNALRECQDVLRETGYPNPGSGDEVVALHTPGLGAQNVAVTNQAALPTFAETNVAVLYGAGFAGGAASELFDGHLTRLIDLYNEDVLKDDSAELPTDLLLTFVTTTDAEDVQIACVNDGVFNATIDWGDGEQDAITAYDDADLTHTYAIAGAHRVIIRGAFPNIDMSNGDKLKLTEVRNIGSTGLTGLANAFNGCTNMVHFNHGSGNLSGVLTLASAFQGCTGLTYLDASDFDVSACTVFDSLFKACTNLVTIDGLSAAGWDVSSGTDFGEMFSGCTVLTGIDLSGWVTTAALTLDGMFNACPAITTLDVTSFDTSNVTTMANMFDSCTGLTTIDVSGFDVAAVTDMASMFDGCAALTDVEIDGWDVQLVADFSDFMLGVTLPTARYDATLIAWDALDVTDSLTVEFGSSTYTGGGAAATARAALISTDSWTINDGGIAA